MVLEYDLLYIVLLSWVVFHSYDLYSQEQNELFSYFCIESVQFGAHLEFQPPLHYAGMTAGGSI